MKQTDNAILELAWQIRNLTLGMCCVGPGPYGFGVGNTNPANIAIVLRTTPDPFEDKTLSLDAKEITMAVEAHFKNNPTKQLDETIVRQLTTDSDAATHVVAASFVELSKAPIVVSKQECIAAFDYLAQQEITDTAAITQEEALKIAGTHWYEGKTAEEIVEFQLYESRLCMPFDKFHEAVETVLGRPVLTHEFARVNLLQAQFIEYKTEMLNQTFAADDTQSSGEFGMNCLNM